MREPGDSPPKTRWVWKVALVLAAACTAPEDSARLSQRLLPDGPELAPRPAEVADETVIATYDLGEESEARRWRPERVDTVEPTPRGIVVTSASADPSLVRDLELDAGRVDAVRVSLDGLPSTAYLQLYWAGAGEPFAEERSVAVATADPTGSLLPTYTFEVGRHDGWSGTVRRLRLDPNSVPGRRVEVVSLRAISRELDPTRLREMTRRSWRVDLTGDARRAVLTPPGLPFERTVALPVGRAAVRVGYGVESGVTSATEFRLRVTAPVGATATLLSDVVRPAPRPTWRDRTVDLSGYGGSRVTLTFECASPAGSEPFEGFPAWSGLEVVAPGDPPQRPNVVLVVLDTLRADHLSLYGYDRPTSPQIDRWAGGRGVTFLRTVAPAPWTLPSHVTLFTGLDAMRHGVNSGQPCPEALTTLAERLRAAGYATHAVTGGGYLAPEFGLLQGFDTVRYHHRPRENPELAGDDIALGVDRALRWLEQKAAEPFFLLLHSYEVHSPYRPREPHLQRIDGRTDAAPGGGVDTYRLPPDPADGYRSRYWLERVRRDGSREPLAADEVGLARDLYDASIGYADAHVGRLLAGLDRRDGAGPTLVILTSDHGEALGEEGRADHASLLDAELLVPLVVALPDGHGAGRRIARQVRLADVAPTVLEVVGIPAATDGDGLSLLPLLEEGGSPAPRHAWSYASASNWGISSRRGELAYTFNNSAWPPIFGQESLTSAGDAPAGTTAFRDELLARYRELIPGVLIEVRNSRRRTLRVVLDGVGVTPQRVKAVSMGRCTARWVEQTVTVDVPREDRAELVVEGPTRWQLAVRIESVGDGARHDEVIDLAALEGEWHAALATGGWHTTRDGTVAATGVSVRVRDPYRGRQGADGDLPELRALGYVQ